MHFVVYFILILSTGGDSPDPKIAALNEFLASGKIMQQLYTLSLTLVPTQRHDGFGGCSTVFYAADMQKHVAHFAGPSTGPASVGEPRDALTIHHLCVLPLLLLYLALSFHNFAQSFSIKCQQHNVLTLYFQLKKFGECSIGTNLLNCKLETSSLNYQLEKNQVSFGRNWR